MLSGVAVLCFVIQDLWGVNHALALAWFSKMIAALW
jgi:hypothetical protein